MKFGKNFKKFKGSSFFNALVLLGIFVLVLVVLTRVAEHSRKTEALSYSQFLNQVESGQVAQVAVSGSTATGLYKNGQRFEATIAETPNNWEILRKHNVEFSVSEPTNYTSPWMLMFFMLFLGGFVIALFLMRQSRGSGGGGIFSVGKSNAKKILPSQINVRFDDVAGAKEAKEELQDIVDFLKNPKKYKRIGAQLTRGVLLVGEPGNGKTLLAKAVAGEANCPFYSITGSDFIEVFVGVGASRIRDLFAQARKKTPCIIFIDEIDAIGRRRGSGLGGGHDEREQTLNQLLTEMDGFATEGMPVVVLAATNMPGVLDKALLRPGRFDRRVTVPFPDEEARRQIITINSRKIVISEEVDVDKIVKDSAGFSGADLANMINQAAINASKNGRKSVEQEDIDLAFNKLIDSQRASRSEHKSSGSDESTARMYMPSQIKVRFDDVAGLSEAKEELVDFIDYLKNPDRYKKIGAKLTRGVLLVGDPGNGKTLLARAVAGEAGRPFFSASGSEFIEKYVGVGAARIRDLFAQARRHSPSILFIDEIDAIGSQRSPENQEHSQTLNQLLTEMDGFEDEGTSVIVLAATNRVDILDKALTRAGRFDRRVEVPYPDLKSRRSILNVHIKNVQVDESVDFDKIARGTPGFSGADIANLVNEAVLNAVKQNREFATIDDFEEARDKILMGKESKSMVQAPDDLRATAYHEAGHALMRLLQPEHTHPLHKVTIVPRGRALGFAAHLPERDKYAQSKEELEAEMIVALGGRVGEEVGLGKQFTGVTSDLQKVTSTARRMVCDYGMSETLGLLSYSRDNVARDCSPDTANKIDQEVRTLVDRCHKRAVKLMQDNKDKLETLTQALLDKETLQAEEIYELLNIEPRVVHKLA